MTTYQIAGWLAIAAAVLFGVGLVFHVTPALLTGAVLGLVAVLGTAVNIVLSGLIDLATSPSPDRSRG